MYLDVHDDKYDSKAMGHDDDDGDRDDDGDDLNGDEYDSKGNGS